MKYVEIRVEWDNGNHEDLEDILENGQVMNSIKDRTIFDQVLLMAEGKYIINFSKARAIHVTREYTKK